MSGALGRAWPWSPLAPLPPGHPLAGYRSPHQWTETTREAERPAVEFLSPPNVPSRAAGGGDDPWTGFHELQADTYLTEALDFAPGGREIREATRAHIASNRDLLKTRLLDTSGPLHSDLDRPDAEATFRMALWPPLAAIAIYLTLEVSWWWAFALVVPVLLAWQWLSLRRKANDALIAAFVARDELGGAAAQAEVRKDTVVRLIERLRQVFDGTSDFRPPSFLLDYPREPSPSLLARARRVERVPDRLRPSLERLRPYLMRLKSVGPIRLMRLLDRLSRLFEVRPSAGAAGESEPQPGEREPPADEPDE